MEPTIYQIKYRIWVTAMIAVVTKVPIRMLDVGKVDGENTNIDDADISTVVDTAIRMLGLAASSLVIIDALPSLGVLLKTSLYPPVADQAIPGQPM